MKNKRFIAFILCMILTFTAVFNVSAAGVTAIKIVDKTDGEEVAEHFDYILDIIVDEYKYEISKEELLKTTVSEFLKAHPEYLADFGKAAFGALDQNSQFYTLEEYTDVYSDVSGNYVGIGIYVSQEGTKIVLGEPIKGSPAENSGLRVGDVIKAVDGVDVTDYALDRVTSLIRGEPDTQVDITVLRNGIEYTYRLTRAEIKIESVTYNVIEGTDVGYVKIASFNANTSEEFVVAMQDLAEKGVSKLVLDLRNNLGGYLSAALVVASYFVPDNKVIVTREHKDPDDNISYVSYKTPHKFKAAVLINQYSASASELVACAIRDYNSGVLVGKRSYGKGTVQEVIPLGSFNYMWMTVAEYFTPSHTPIHSVGLDPDYIVANTIAKFDMSTLTPYDILRVMKHGDTGEDVRALKERLRILGYSLADDDVYDTNTVDAITELQKATELFPYGVADFTTQIKLNDVMANLDVEVDRQYEMAVELAKELK